MWADSYTQVQSLPAPIVCHAAQAWTRLADNAPISGIKIAPRTTRRKKLLLEDTVVVTEQPEKYFVQAGEGALSYKSTDPIGS